MRILVIGANGQIGKQAVKLLSDRGYEVRAMIRNPEQAPQLEELGGQPVIADLEKDFSHAVQGVEAIIFTAGSGAHTGPDKTVAVDQNGAIRSIEEAEQRGIKRYIIALPAWRPLALDMEMKRGVGLSPQRNIGIHPLVEANGNIDSQSPVLLAHLSLC